MKGKLVFDIHPAKKLLREDVKNGVHKHLKPKEMQKTRWAYMEFSLQIFTHRIYQEVRRKKFLHFMNLKRQKERPLPTGNAPHSADVLKRMYLDRLAQSRAAYACRR